MCRFHEDRTEFVKKFGKRPINGYSTINGWRRTINVRTTAGGQRKDVGISSRKTQKSVIRRCAVFEFSESCGRFYPGFCEANEIRMMRVDEITDGSRVIIIIIIFISQLNIK